jgi:hypothetical protein
MPRIDPATRAHRRAAIRDARHLLAGVVAPPGAVEKSSGTGVGPSAHLITEALDSAVARRSWTVAEDLSSVLSFVTSHLPPGSRPDGTEGGSSPPSLAVIRTWPPIAGVLGGRWLQIQATSLSTNRTLLSVVAQSEWIAVRPASERIPAGVRVIDITSGVPGKRPFLSRTVTSQEHVRFLIHLFDFLPIVQPGVINCPEESTNQPVVTVTFRDGKASQPAARARVSSAANVRWPETSGAWACLAVQFTVLGGRQPALAGNVIGPLQRLLNVNLAKPSS